jgi:hypothetical protein
VTFFAWIFPMFRPPVLCTLSIMGPLSRPQCILLCPDDYPGPLCLMEFRHRIRLRRLSRAQIQVVHHIPMMCCSWKAYTRA